MNSRNRKLLIVFLLASCSFVLLGFHYRGQSTNPAREKLERWRRSRVTLWMNDFGQLARYRDADKALRYAPGRTVFFGDSIIDLWDLAQYFPTKPYVNRGISGQTTSQMLLRFQQDVVDLHPARVLILAGSNDIAGVTGETPLETIEANFRSMAELSRSHGIKVVFASILAVHSYTPESKYTVALHPPDKILALNRWLKSYCDQNRFAYLDYFSAMIDERGFLKRELSDDGLHPNAEGYRIMTSLAETAMEPKS